MFHSAGCSIHVGFLVLMWFWCKQQSHDSAVDLIARSVCFLPGPILPLFAAGSYLAHVCVLLQVG